MTTENSERKTGICKWFNSKKGFGFITADDESGDVFCHQSGIHAEGFRSLLEGEPVEYTLETDEFDRVKAVQITGPDGAFVKGSPKPEPRRRRRNYRNRNRNGNKNENEENHEQEITQEPGASKLEEVNKKEEAVVEEEQKLPLE